uniref:PHD-type domain-containing protein n=1 Tax=Glossina brevipalpis TaxID=37001 RepID=A0A1A9WSD5_9MUSC
MDCLYANCSSKTGSGHDRFLVCWLCQRLGHSKCAGLTGRAADAVVDGSKGLRWSCPECRPRDIDFYRLFGQTKIGFCEIGKELACLAKKFAKYQKLFDEYEYLKSLPQKNKKIPDTCSVACGPSPTSAVHILIPDAKAPVL